MKLWYKEPATCWEEVLPIGNGRLGAMIWGDIDRGLIGLNEDSLWSGYERDKNNYNAHESLEKVREMIFNEKYVEAEALMAERMMGENTESYLPLGVWQFI